MTNFRLVLLATSALTVSSLMTTPSHAQSAPVQFAQAAPPTESGQETRGKNCRRKQHLLIRSRRPAHLRDPRLPRPMQRRPQRHHLQLPYGRPRRRHRMLRRRRLRRRGRRHHLNTQRLPLLRPRRKLRRRRSQLYLQQLRSHRCPQPPHRHLSQRARRLRPRQNRHRRPLLRPRSP